MTLANFIVRQPWSRHPISSLLKLNSVFHTSVLNSCSAPRKLDRTPNVCMAREASDRLFLTKSVTAKGPFRPAELMGRLNRLPEQVTVIWAFGKGARGCGYVF